MAVETKSRKKHPKKLKEHKKQGPLTLKQHSTLEKRKRQYVATAGRAEAKRGHAIHQLKNVASKLRRSDLTLVSNVLKIMRTIVISIFDNAIRVFDGSIIRRMMTLTIILMLLQSTTAAYSIQFSAYYEENGGTRTHYIAMKSDDASDGFTSVIYTVNPNQWREIGRTADQAGDHAFFGNVRVHPSLYNHGNTDAVSPTSRWHLHKCTRIVHGNDTYADLIAHGEAYYNNLAKGCAYMLRPREGDNNQSTIPDYNVTAWVVYNPTVLDTHFPLVREVVAPVAPFFERIESALLRNHWLYLVGVGTLYYYRATRPLSYIALFLALSMDLPQIHAASKKCVHLDQQDLIVAGSASRVNIVVDRGRCITLKIENKPTLTISLNDANLAPALTYSRSWATQVDLTESSSTDHCPGEGELKCPHEGEKDWTCKRGNNKRGWGNGCFFFGSGRVCTCVKKEVKQKFREYLINRNRIQVQLHVLAEKTGSSAAEFADANFTADSRVHDISLEDLGTVRANCEPLGLLDYDHKRVLIDGGRAYFASDAFIELLQLPVGICSGDTLDDCNWRYLDRMVAWGEIGVHSIESQCYKDQSENMVSDLGKHSAVVTNRQHTPVSLYANLGLQCELDLRNLKIVTTSLPECKTDLSGTLTIDSVTDGTVVARFSTTVALGNGCVFRYHGSCVALHDHVEITTSSVSIIKLRCPPGKHTLRVGASERVINMRGSRVTHFTNTFLKNAKHVFGVTSTGSFGLGRFFGIVGSIFTVAGHAVHGLFASLLGGASTLILGLLVIGFAFTIRSGDRRTILIILGGLLVLPAFIPSVKSEEVVSISYGLYSGSLSVGYGSIRWHQRLYYDLFGEYFTPTVDSVAPSDTHSVEGRRFGSITLPVNNYRELINRFKEPVASLLGKETIYLNVIFSTVRRRPTHTASIELGRLVFTQWNESCPHLVDLVHSPSVTTRLLHAANDTSYALYSSMFECLTGSYSDQPIDVPEGIMAEFKSQGIPFFTEGHEGCRWYNDHDEYYDFLECLELKYRRTAFSRRQRRLMNKGAGKGSSWVDTFIKKFAGLVDNTAEAVRSLFTEDVEATYKALRATVDSYHQALADSITSRIAKGKRNDHVLDVGEKVAWNYMYQYITGWVPASQRAEFESKTNKYRHTPAPTVAILRCWSVEASAYIPDDEVEELTKLVKKINIPQQRLEAAIESLPPKRAFFHERLLSVIGSLPSGNDIVSRTAFREWRRLQQRIGHAVKDMSILNAINEAYQFSAPPPAIALRTWCYLVASEIPAKDLTKCTHNTKDTPPPPTAPSRTTDDSSSSHHSYSEDTTTVRSPDVHLLAEAAAHPAGLARAPDYADLENALVSDGRLSMIILALLLSYGRELLALFMGYCMHAPCFTAISIGANCARRSGHYCHVALDSATMYLGYAFWLLAHWSSGVGCCLAYTATPLMIYHGKLDVAQVAAICALAFEIGLEAIPYWVVMFTGSLIFVSVFYMAVGSTETTTTTRGAITSTITVLLSALIVSLNFVKLTVHKDYVPPLSNDNCGTDINPPVDLPMGHDQLTNRVLCESEVETGRTTRIQEMTVALLTNCYQPQAGTTHDPLPLADGRYAIYYTLFGFKLVRVGTAFVKEATMATQGHVTSGKPIYVNGVAHAPNHVEPTTDSIFYGKGEFATAPVKDGDSLYWFKAGQGWVRSDAVTVKDGINTYVTTNITTQQHHGYSGEPFFIKDNGSTRFAGMMGWVPGSSGQVDRHLLQADIPRNLRMNNELKTVISRGGYYSVVSYPGSGKTSKLVPQIIAAADSTKKVYLAVPTTAIKNEVLARGWHLTDDNFSVITHRALACKLINSASSCDGCVIIFDESHFSNTDTLLAQKILRERLDQSISLITMTATSPELVSKESNAVINDITCQDNDDLYVQLDNTITGNPKATIMLFVSTRTMVVEKVAGLRAKHADLHVVGCVGGDADKNKAKLATLADHEQWVVVCTNCLEVGVNVNPDYVFDECTQVHATYTQFPSGSISTEMCTYPSSVAQRVQRRGRIRTGNGFYYAVDKDDSTRCWRKDDLMHVVIAILCKATLGFVPAALSPEDGSVDVELPDLAGHKLRQFASAYMDMPKEQDIGEPLQELLGSLWLDQRQPAKTSEFQRQQEKTDLARTAARVFWRSSDLIRGSASKLLSSDAAPQGPTTFRTTNNIVIDLGDTLSNFCLAPKALGSQPQA